MQYDILKHIKSYIRNIKIFKFFKEFIITFLILIIKSLCKQARKEIDEMIMRLASDAAVSFKQKARFIPEL